MTERPRLPELDWRDVRAFAMVIRRLSLSAM